MANTYTLISSYTLGSNTANGVTFSSIPSTYTHLLINFSVGDTRSGSKADDLRISINGNSGSYSNVRLYGADGGCGQDGGTGVNNTYFGFCAGNDAAASVFGNGTMLFPNYTSSTTKNGTQNSGVQGSLSGTTGYQIGLVSIASPVTAAITSIAISGYNAPSGTLTAGSTLFLYGLKST
jgi:hypothetical protein